MFNVSQVLTASTKIFPDRNTDNSQPPYAVVKSMIFGFNGTSINGC